MFGIESQKCYKQKLIQYWVALFCSLWTSASADQEPLTFRPRAVAGLVCYANAPAEWRQLLEDVQTEYQRPLNNLGGNFLRSMDRRFGARLQIPYAKGVVLVDTNTSIERWYCEQSFTAEGARELVDDFAAQWQTDERIERPNYEVKVLNLSPESWSMELNNLTWTPKLVDTTDAERQKTGLRVKTEWTASKRAGRSVWFRFHKDWLWSSYSDDLLKAESLDLIPDAKNLRLTDGKLYAQAWVSPDQLSLPLRTSLLSAIDTVLAVESQQRDGESAPQAHRRRALNTCRSAVVYAALNDVDSANLFVLTSADRVSVHARINAKDDTQLSGFLHDMVPGQVEKVPQLKPVPGMAFRVIARIPESVLSLFELHDANHKEARLFELVASGNVICDSLEELSGLLTIRCTDPKRVLKTLTDSFPGFTDFRVCHTLFNEVPLRVLTTLKDDGAQLETSITGPSFQQDLLNLNDMTEALSTDTNTFRQALIEFHADSRTVESVARAWFLKIPQEREENRSDPLVDVATSISLGRDGITLDFFCTKSFARRVFASLTLSH